MGSGLTEVTAVGWQELQQCVDSSGLTEVTAVGWQELQQWVGRSYSSGLGSVLTEVTAVGWQELQQWVSLCKTLFNTNPKIRLQWQLWLTLP